MAARRVRIMPRYKAPHVLEPLTGSTLIQPVSAPNQFAASVAQLVDEMRSETLREIIRVYPVRRSVSDGATFDASGGASVITKVLNALKTRFMKRFKSLAKSAAPEMVERMSKDSRQRIRASVREVLPNMTIDNTKLPQNVKDVIDIGSRQAASMIVTIPEKYLSDVANSTLQAILHGRGTKELEEELDQYGHKTRNWARNVALDQTRKVYNALNRENMRSLGITKFVWVHSNSTQNPRKYHQTVLKGQTFSIDNPPVIDPRTGERGFPGQLPYCLPASSKVENTAVTLKLYRHLYTGELISFVTNQGAVLKTTPNHPILTSTGWKSAHLVNEGDYLVNTGDHRLYGLKSDINDGKSTIGDLFDAAVSCFGVNITRGSDAGFEFHGDLTDKKIDVIHIDRVLPDTVNPASVQHFCENILAFADSGAPSFADSGCSALLLLTRSCTASPGIVRRLYPLLSALWGSAVRAGAVRRAASSYLDVCIQKAAANDRAADAVFFREMQLAFSSEVTSDNFCIGNILASFSYCAARDVKSFISEGATQIVRVDAESIGDVFQHHANGKQLDRIVQKSVSVFSDHVYNLHNVNNWFSSEGLIVHNCRCTMRPVIELDTEEN